MLQTVDVRLGRFPAKLQLPMLTVAHLILRDSSQHHIPCLRGGRDRPGPHESNPRKHKARSRLESTGRKGACQRRH